MTTYDLDKVKERAVVEQEMSISFPFFETVKDRIKVHCDICGGRNLRREGGMTIETVFKDGRCIERSIMPIETRIWCIDCDAEIEYFKVLKGEQSNQE